MPDSGTDYRSKLIAAIEESDDMRRHERADRIEWLSKYQIHNGIITGPIDTLAVLHEARDCFVEGHYIAALLLADAFIEHSIIDELIERGCVKQGEKVNAIEVAQENNTFLEDMLSRAGHLRKIRNPFVHRKNSTHQLSFSNRFIQSGAHPTSLLEKDAKDALALMYAFFYATLKEE